MKWEEKPADSVESLEWGMFTGLYGNLGQCVAWMDRDPVFQRLLAQAEASEECAWSMAARVWELVHDEEDDPGYIHIYEAPVLAVLYALALARRRAQWELAAEAVRPLGLRMRLANHLVQGLAPDPAGPEDLLDMEAAVSLFGWKWVHVPGPVLAFSDVETVYPPGTELKGGAAPGRGELTWRSPSVPRYSTDPALVGPVVERAFELGATELRIGGGPGSWTASLSLPSSRTTSGSARTISGAVSSAAVAAARALEDGGRRG